MPATSHQMTSWPSQEEPRNLVPGWDVIYYRDWMGWNLDVIYYQDGMGWDGISGAWMENENLESRLPGSFSLGANI